MICQLRRRLLNRTLVIVADSTYAARELPAHCAQLREPVTLITRLRLDAALYDPAPAPARTATTVGRPRKNGARQPTLAQRLTDPATTWETITVAWYGGAQRTIRVAAGTAVWYHSGKPPVPIRWVLITDPGQHPFEPQALLSTDPTVAAQQISEWFVLRRQEDATLEECRAHLGIETQRQWSDQAIARTTPLVLGLFSLVTVLARQFLQGQERRATVRQADLTRPLDFAAAGAFDTIVCPLVLHYLQDWQPTLHEFARVLRPQGVLVFSTHHPCMDWQMFQTGDYFALTLLEDTWEAIGMVQFYRRPLTAISEALDAAGFVIERLLEPQPTADFQRVAPDLYERVMRNPWFLVVRARKAGSV